MVLNPFYFRRLENDRVFISNVLGSWAVVDETEFMDMVASTNDTAQSATFNALGFFSEKSSFFDKAAETYLTRKFARPYAKPSLIMVVPTLRCDHNCEYCQVSRAPVDAFEFDLALNPDALACSIDRIAAPEFKLEFQGGEALLRIDFVVETVAALRKIRGQSFSVVITSALGPDLPEEFLVWCKKEGIAFSVSFDGIPEIHSAHRKSNFFDSFSRFSSQLERLKSSGINEIGYVQTVTRSTLQLDPDRIIEACRSLGIERLFSRPLQQYGFATLTQKKLGYTREEFVEFFDSYFCSVLRNWKKDRSFFDDGFGIYLANLFRASNPNYVDLMSPAAYGLQAVIINYDGNIFGADETRMLFETTKNEELVLATISPDGSIVGNLEPHAAFIADSFLEFNPYCDTCAYQPFCGSDLAHHLSTQGNGLGFKPESAFCSSTMGVFDLLATRFANEEFGLDEVSEWLT